MGRLEDVSKYLNNVSIKTLDITQADFKQWTESGLGLEPQYLELFGEKKKIMRECVVSVLKHMVQISNSNLLRNADDSLARIDKYLKVKWVRKNMRVDTTKFPTTYCYYHSVDSTFYFLKFGQLSFRFVH